MSARGWRLLGLAVCLVVAAGCVPDPGPGQAIGPNQRFRGLVNGSSAGAILTTVCPGPGSPGGTGHLAAGQTVSAELDPTGPGDTGDNGAVFVEPNATMQVVQLRTWGEAVELPTEIQVPCDGPGTMVFDPCFGIVGCRGSAHAHVVKVTFVNIAV